MAGVRPALHVARSGGQLARPTHTNAAHGLCPQTPISQWRAYKDRVHTMGRLRSNGAHPRVPSNDIGMRLECGIAVWAGCGHALGCGSPVPDHYAVAVPPEFTLKVPCWMRAASVSGVTQVLEASTAAASLGVQVTNGVCAQ